MQLSNSKVHLQKQTENATDSPPMSHFANRFLKLKRNNSMRNFSQAQKRVCPKKKIQIIFYSITDQRKRNILINILVLCHERRKVK